MKTGHRYKTSRDIKPADRNPAEDIKPVSSFKLSVLSWARLDFLEALYVVDARDFAYAIDDIFQVLQVCDVEHDVDVGLAVIGAGFDIADVGFGIADDGSDLLQHAEAVVAEYGEFHGIGVGRAIVLGPLDVDSPLRFIHQVHHVGTIERVDGDAFAAGHVADDGFAADRVTTACAIDQQVALSLDADGVVVLVATENATHHTGQAGGFLGLVFRQGFAGRGRQASQYLPRGEFSIADSGHEIVRASYAVVGGDLLQLFVLDIFHGHAVLPRFFLDQLSANLNGALALMDIEPVLDLVTGAG